MAANDFGGDLYKMQQEAILRARETRAKSTLPPIADPAPPATEPERPPATEKKQGILGMFSGLFSGGSSGNGLGGGFLSGIKSDDIMLLLILYLLIKEGADDDIVLIFVFLVLSGWGK